MRITSIGDETMTQMILALFPLVALIASGYLFKKYQWLSAEFWSGAEKLNYYVLFPALLFHHLATAEIEIQHLSAVIAATVMVIGLVTAALYSVRFFVDIHPARFGVHVQSLIRFNTYIGLALISTLFQTQGMAIFAILMVLCIPLINVISILALTSSDQMAIKPVAFALLKNPLILGCVVGGVFNLFNLPVWQGLAKLTSLLAAASLPLGLLCVGAALQFMQMKKDIGVLLFDTLGRLLMVPALTYVVCSWFGLSAFQTQILVIFFALPTASASYILTKVLGGDSQLMAAVISFQTLCAALTIPLVMWWVL